METARLILLFIQALAWPTVAMIVVYLFKAPLTILLNQLHDAEIPGGVKLNFQKEIQQAEDWSRQVKDGAREKKDDNSPNLPRSEINSRMVSLGLRPSPSGVDLDYYRRLAAQDPNIALAGLRMEMEILARNLAKGYKIDFKERDTANTIFQNLYNHDFITIEQLQLIKTVLKLCNAAIHGTNVSRQEAESVLDVAKVLADDFISWLSWGFQDGWVPDPGQSKTKA